MLNPSFRNCEGEAKDVSISLRFPPLKLLSLHEQTENDVRYKIEYDSRSY